MEQRVLEREEFGLLLLDELDELIRKQYPNVEDGFLDVAIPLRIGFKGGKSCTCRMVCTYRDGTLECICNCSGSCDGTEPCN